MYLFTDCEPVKIWQQLISGRLNKEHEWQSEMTNLRLCHLPCYTYSRDKNCRDHWHTWMDMAGLVSISYPILIFTEWLVSSWLWSYWLPSIYHSHLLPWDIFQCWYSSMLVHVRLSHILLNTVTVTVCSSSGQNHSLYRTDVSVGFLKADYNYIMLNSIHWQHFIQTNIVRNWYYSRFAHHCGVTYNQHKSIQSPIIQYTDNNMLEI